MGYGIAKAIAKEAKANVTNACENVKRLINLKKKQQFTQKQHNQGISNHSNKLFFASWSLKKITIKNIKSIKFRFF